MNDKINMNFFIENLGFTTGIIAITAFFWLIFPHLFTRLILNKLPFFQELRLRKTLKSIVLCQFIYGLLFLLLSPLLYGASISLYLDWNSILFCVAAFPYFFFILTPWFLSLSFKNPNIGWIFIGAFILTFSFAISFVIKSNFQTTFKKSFVLASIITLTTFTLFCVSILLFNFFHSFPDLIG